MALDPALLEILVCPACRSRVRPQGDELACTGCDLVYPVRDGSTPLMLVELARSRQEG